MQQISRVIGLAFLCFKLCSEVVRIRLDVTEVTWNIATWHALENVYMSS